MKGVILVLDLLFMLSGTALAISFLLYSATKGEIKKDNELQRVPTKKMLKMRKVTGQMMGVSGAVLFFAFAINLSSPARDTSPSEPKAVEATETESDSQSEEQAKLGPYSVAAIPNNVPSSYTMQYKELSDIISRADGTLRLIKNTINKCEAPCTKPLSEIEQQFLLLSDVIDETRNELFRGSEIARIMADENPQGLDALKLYELQQDLISTEYSLETMQLADSWESWEEPVEYVESTREKRLYKTSLASTILSAITSIQNDNGSFSNEVHQEAEYFKAIGLTIEFGRETMTELSYLSYMCGKVCPDIPGDTWALQLEPMNNEIFSLQRNMYEFAQEIRQIPIGSSDNVDFKEIEDLASKMELFADYITPIMTKRDWSSWKEAHTAVDEAISIINEMRVEDIYTLPTIN